MYCIISNCITQGAGVLHNEFSPALLALHDAPAIRGVTIRKAAHDGLSLVAVVDPLEMLYNRLVFFFLQKTK